MLPLALVILIIYFLFSDNSSISNNESDSNTDTSSNHDPLSLEKPEDFFILGMFFDDDEFF